MARYLFGLDLDGAPPPADFCGLDTAVVGSGTFLSALEVSLGLAPLEMRSLERALAYSHAVAAQSDADAFFAGSFEVNPLAIARLLLGWRDELVEAAHRSLEILEIVQRPSSRPAGSTLCRLKVLPELSSPPSLNDPVRIRSRSKSFSAFLQLFIR
jgi:hypothetical protein